VQLKGIIFINVLVVKCSHSNFVAELPQCSG